MLQSSKPSQRSTTCNVSLPQGGYTATRLVVPQLDLVVVPPIRPSAYL